MVRLISFDERPRSADPRDRLPTSGSLQVTMPARGIARGRVLVFLNNDTVVAPDWLGVLTRVTRAADRRSASRARGSFSPMIRRRVDSAGDGYLHAAVRTSAVTVGGRRFRRIVRSVRRMRLRDGRCNASCSRRLGGFDTAFFLVYEDVDLSYRAQLLGARCWYTADAIVHHAGSGTMGRQSVTAVFYGQRNLEWTWLKNTPGSLLARSFISHAIYSLAGLAFYARQGLLWTALKGKFAAFAGVARVLAERRRVQREHTTSISPTGEVVDAIVVAPEAAREEWHTALTMWGGGLPRRYTDTTVQEWRG